MATIGSYGKTSQKLWQISMAEISVAYGFPMVLYLPIVLRPFAYALMTA